AVLGRRRPRAVRHGRPRGPRREEPDLPQVEGDGRGPTGLHDRAVHPDRRDRHHPPAPDPPGGDRARRPRSLGAAAARACRGRDLDRAPGLVRFAPCCGALTPPLLGRWTSRFLGIEDCWDSLDNSLPKSFRLDTSASLSTFPLRFARAGGIPWTTNGVVLRSGFFGKSSA